MTARALATLLEYNTQDAAKLYPLAEEFMGRLGAAAGAQ